MNDQVKKSNFIKLDRRLIQVLGLNKAVVLCHLLGVQEAITKTTNNNSFYQTLDVLIYNLDISKTTLIKIIKSLEDLHLIRKIEHQQKNKNHYIVNKINYNYLIEIIDDEIKPKDKKNKATRKQIKEKVIQKYTSSMKIDTTSSDKNDTISSIKISTTNKDLNKREYKEKRITSKDIKSLFNDLPYLRDLFSKNISDNDLCIELNKYTTRLIRTLNYFAYKYFKVMKKKHKLIRNFKVLNDIMEAIDTMYNYDDYGIYNDADTMQFIIDEFIELPNIKDPSIFVFISNMDDIDNIENSFPYIITQRNK